MFGAIAKNLLFFFPPGSPPGFFAPAPLLPHMLRALRAGEGGGPRQRERDGGGDAWLKTTGPDPTSPPDFPPPFLAAPPSPLAASRCLLPTRGRAATMTTSATPADATTARAPPPPVRRWTGAGSQADLMLTDHVITVDESDRVLGGASKRDAHTFGPGGPSPVGALHRAFSVFLFDAATDRLLLQRRALAKITFPGVWTNTCCSHQLHGQSPPELDADADVAAGRAPGAVAAAQRKLAHELGVPVGTIPDAAFRYVTRLHYCAADTATHGPDAPWGEHEVDYVLLARHPAADLPLTPHPDEVEDTRWVSRDELGAMMDPGSGLAWSPWFRIIADRWLPGWWDNLDGVLERGEGAEWGKVHRVM